MSFILGTCLLLSMAVNCISTSESFFDHLVSDHRRHSYFLVVNVDSPSYKGKTIIENGSLVLFLYRTQGIPETKYESFARGLLVNQSWLKTKKVNLERWGFRKLTRIKTVDDVAAKGKEEFIKYYFGGKEGRVLKAGVTDYEKPAIIEKLFEWEVAASRDDETGRLFYTEFKQDGDTPALNHRHGGKDD